MALPKFIITMDGYLRLGMVNQHKDLLIGDDSCIGGGYYQFDWASNRLLLDRASYDFGRPRWHLLESLKVPASYRGLRIVYIYDDDFHEVAREIDDRLNVDRPRAAGADLFCGGRAINVSDELQIEYYD